MLFTHFTVDQSKLTVNGSVLSDTPNVRYLVALYSSLHVASCTGRAHTYSPGVHFLAVYCYDLPLMSVNFSFNIFNATLGLPVSTSRAVLTAPLRNHPHVHKGSLLCRKGLLASPERHRLHPLA